MSSFPPSDLFLPGSLIFLAYCFLADPFRPVLGVFCNLVFIVRVLLSSPPYPFLYETFLILTTFQFKCLLSSAAKRSLSGPIFGLFTPPYDSFFLS